MKENMPSGRDMAIYYEVRVVCRTQAAVALDFEITQSRVSQIVREVAAWRAAQSPRFGTEREAVNRVSQWECRERTSVLLSWAMADYLESRQSLVTERRGVMPSGDFCETVIRQQRANARLLKLAMDLNERLAEYDDLPLPPEPPAEQEAEDRDQESGVRDQEPGERLGNVEWDQPAASDEAPAGEFLAGESWKIDWSQAAKRSAGGADEEIPEPATEESSPRPVAGSQDAPIASEGRPANDDDESEYFGGSREAHLKFIATLSRAEVSDVLAGRVPLRDFYERYVESQKNINSQPSADRDPLPERSRRAPGEPRLPRTAADFERVERRLLSGFENRSATVLHAEQADHDAAKILPLGRIVARMQGVDRATFAFLVRWKKVRLFRSRTLGDIQLPQPRKPEPGVVQLIGPAAQPLANTGCGA